HDDPPTGGKNLEFEAINFLIERGRIPHSLTALMSTIHRMDEPASSQRRSLQQLQSLLAAGHETGPRQGHGRCVLM
ncbi:hypothetical protein ABTD96_21140, partial [Acinetobacter baumannii]